MKILYIEREILNIFLKGIDFCNEEKMYGTLRLVNSREIEYQVDGCHWSLISLCVEPLISWNVEKAVCV